MTRARRSGIQVHSADIPIVLGMVKRGDRRHDIAAWFGYNQGRVAEVEAGKHGVAQPAPFSELPPSGSPGLKAKELRIALDRVQKFLSNNNIEEATKVLTKAVEEFDRNE